MNQRHHAAIFNRISPLLDRAEEVFREEVERIMQRADRIYLNMQSDPQFAQFMLEHYGEDTDGDTRQYP